MPSLGLLETATHLECEGESPLIPAQQSPARAVREKSVKVLKDESCFSAYDLLLSCLSPRQLDPTPKLSLVGSYFATKSFCVMLYLCVPNVPSAVRFLISRRSTTKRP